MHRSRLSTLLIDVPSDQATDATAFWSAALGVQANPVPGEEQFTSLPGAFPGLQAATSCASSRCTATLTLSVGSHALGTSAVRSASIVALTVVRLPPGSG
jgi:hypothetical protein